MTRTARLYNPFQDLRSVEMTHNKDSLLQELHLSLSHLKEYPSGEQFMYTMDIRQAAVAHLQAGRFHDR